MNGTLFGDIFRTQKVKPKLYPAGAVHTWANLNTTLLPGGSGVSQATIYDRHTIDAIPTSTYDIALPILNQYNMVQYLGDIH